MAKDSMTFKLFGRDVSLSKTFDKAGKNAKKSVDGIGGSLAGLGLAGAAAAVGAFAAKSVGRFQAVGGETLRLQRYMGGTVEDASRLRHAFAMTGIDIDAATASLGKMSKFAATNGAALEKMGIATRDASGNVKSSSALLGEFSDKIAAMPAGTEKTALVLKVFGRNGMAMLPFLNKGSKGIKELAAQSDALGTTLNGKDADAVKAATLNKRQMGEAVTGLQVSIGKNLLPVLTGFVTFMTTRVVPAISNVVGWLQDNKDVVKVVATVIAALVVGVGGFVKVMQVVAAVTRAWATAQAFLNVVMTANPIGLIIVGIVALVAAIVIAYKRSETFRRTVDGALRFVGAAFRWLKDVAVAAFNWIKTKGFDFIVAVIRNSPFVLLVRGLFAGFKWLREKIDVAVQGVKDKFGSLVDFVAGLPGRIARAARGMWDGLKNGVVAALNWIIDKWNSLDVGFSVPNIPGVPGRGQRFDLVPDVPRLAVGGQMVSDGLIYAHAGEVITPYSKVKTASQGGDIHVHIHGTIVGNDAAAGRALVKMIRDEASRGNRLVPA